MNDITEQNTRLIDFADRMQHLIYEIHDAGFDITAQDDVLVLVRYGSGDGFDGGHREDVPVDRENFDNFNRMVTEFAEALGKIDSLKPNNPEE